MKLALGVTCRSLFSGFAVIVICGISSFTSDRYAETQRAASPREVATKPGSSFAGYRVTKTFAGEHAALVPPNDRTEQHPVAIFQDKEGRIWVGDHAHRSVVHMYDERADTWTTFGPGEEQSVFSGLHFESGALLPSTVHHVCQSEDGVIWFSGAYSYAYSDAIRKSVPYLHPYICLSSYDGKAWRGKSGELDKYMEPLGLIQSAEGGAWFWIADELSHHDAGRWSASVKLSSKIDCDSGGVSPHPTPDPKRSEIACCIEAGAQDREGYLWLCTSGSVLTFNPKTGDCSAYPEIGHSDLVYEDRRGRMWFNTAGPAASMYDRRKGSVVKHKIWDHVPSPYGPYGGEVRPRVRAILEDKQGRIVFAVDGGLLLFSESDNDWSFAAVKELGLEAQGRHNWIRGAMTDRNGRFWLVTVNGIVVLEQDQSQ
jgi:hypothetical protein